MKRLLAFFLIGLFYINLAVASEPQWPKLDYPTRQIGEFMKFCISTLNSMAAQSNLAQYQANPYGAAEAHMNVCSCVIDNYRIHNSYFTFQIEFEAQNKEQVPYFQKYYGECAEINNSLQILRNGS